MAQHFAAVEADCVYNKMRVDVLGIDVCRDEHLALRPSVDGKLFCNIVRSLSVYIFIGMKGLHVVVEINRAVLAVHLAGSEKFLSGKLGRAILTADKLLLIVKGFLLLRYVLRNATQRSNGLPRVFYECDRRHQCCS